VFSESNRRLSKGLRGLALPRRRALASDQR
jgi:hypothetical protein